MQDLKPIAQSNNFIILDKYINIIQDESAYQSEDDLEKELIKDLCNQGYEYLSDLNNTEKMFENAKIQLQKLNNIQFSNDEWKRFCQEYLDKPSDNIIDKTRKIHDDYIYDFIFDDGHIKNIYILDKNNVCKNKVQVIRQFSQKGAQLNRYDVTILINGLPLVQIELKKRGVSIKEAFNQIHRYSKESFNSDNSLYKYLQIFVISNGSDTKYFANTTKRDKNSFEFTMNWAKSDNCRIKDLKDFTATFLKKQTLLNVLAKYCVFDTSNTLLIMRPYQIAAAERIIWKITTSFEAKKHNTIEGGGYIWHTTGSGKTLTSFKAARLATQLDFINKVFFVVDRKDLDYQTMREYQKFSKDSVNGSDNTAGLKSNIQKDDNKIIVTTIQKLNNLMKNENDLDIYSKQVVFIFDECHRSQFGEAQKNLTKKFKKYYQFGFTGTPILDENALGSETTASVFGKNLHSYLITDAIKDEKVLKFKVDYNNVRPNFKECESQTDEKKFSSFETNQALLHPDRINQIAKYILKNFNQKTHRLQTQTQGFNAIFAVSSIDAAKLYYEAFKNLQENKEKPLKIATIFSFSDNESQNSIGYIEDETFEPNAMDLGSKEFLSKAIDDYNNMFGSSYSVESKEFQNYYKDIAKRVRGKDNNGISLKKEEKIDLLIVVGMFLTGFDAQTLNTLFVDKHLKYHGLIQAYSRTNRIYDATKTFGNIVTFRDLEQATIDAITLFCKKEDEKDIQNVILEKSYSEYMNGFEDDKKTTKGFLEIIDELKQKFPNPEQIEKEKDKKDFVELFGQYLKVENILQNYDEFYALKAIQDLDKNDEKAVENFKAQYYLSQEEFDNIKYIQIPSPRIIQDYKSAYNDIREWIRKEKDSKNIEDSKIDWNDVVFEIDLLKSQEINLDYILELIFEHNKKTQNKSELIEEARKTIRASLDNRAKESLIIDFINQNDLNESNDKASLIDDFFKFAQDEKTKELNNLIISENLNEEAAKRYINISLKKGYASQNGNQLNEILPKMSPLNPQYLIKKQDVFEKISVLVDKFKGVGGH